MERESHIEEQDLGIIEEFAKSGMGEESFYEFVKAGKGPGSRGGKVVGHTKGGKPIYESGKRKKKKKKESWGSDYGDYLEAKATHKAAPGARKYKARGKKQEKAKKSMQERYGDYLEAKAQHKKSTESRSYKDRSKKK